MPSVVGAALATAVSPRRLEHRQPNAQEVSMSLSSGVCHGLLGFLGAWSRQLVE